MESLSQEAPSEIYPKMSALAKICRVLPVQTADVERTFSQVIYLAECNNIR